MPNFKTIKEAVYYVCGETQTGWQSSTEELVKEANKVCFRFVEKGSALIYRMQWRKDNNITADCRTYQGQPRRNMLNDKKIHISVLGKLQKVLENGQNAFVELLNEFHSIDQLKNAITHVQQLAKEYDFVSI